MKSVSEQVHKAYDSDLLQVVTVHIQIVRHSIIDPLIINFSLTTTALEGTPSSLAYTISA